MQREPLLTSSPPPPQFNRKCLLPVYSSQLGTVSTMTIPVLPHKSSELWAHFPYVGREGYEESLTSHV